MKFIIFLSNALGNAFSLKSTDNTPSMDTFLNCLTLGSEESSGSLRSLKASS